MDYPELCLPYCCESRHLCKNITLNVSEIMLLFFSDLDKLTPSSSYCEELNEKCSVETGCGDRTYFGEGYFMSHAVS